MQNEKHISMREALLAAAESAVRAIPPAWPLSATVAVNPFLGQAGMTLAETAALLGKVAGARVTMPRRWYAEKIAKGAITDADIASALASAPGSVASLGIAGLKKAALAEDSQPSAVPTVAELAATASGFDWPALVSERFGNWAASHFDAGQALWAMQGRNGAYASWRVVAQNDLTPEIHGLSGFASHVADAPQGSHETILRTAGNLDIGPDEAGLYFHRLLMVAGGWAHAARQRLWQADLDGGTDNTLVDMLAILLVWEEALSAKFGGAISKQWKQARADYAQPVKASAGLEIDAALQAAADHAAQREIAAELASAKEEGPTSRPALQAAFCIDVRSEVFRRALESTSPAVRTIGFAGFFGLAAEHRGFASDIGEKRLPVLLKPSVYSCSGTPQDAAADRNARFAARARRAWGRFKLAAVSSFAFVEATGPLYAGKLVRDSFGIAPGGNGDEPAPRFDPALDTETRTNAAEAVLKAMSLTEGFAPVVLIAGHGANVTNNPHASALHCGACGGHSGEVNARLLAALLNDPEVRGGLEQRGIAIPQDTRFVAGLHDTTTDTVHLYEGDVRNPAPDNAMAQVRDWLARAAVLARAERALALPRASSGSAIPSRSRDWSETRPEWGLAGCRVFIAAPRARTAGSSLAGRAFLHDYDWRKDKGFPVLELIMTAPVVVASWISLQYYGSTVAPEIFGGGNKLLHNVTGGMGVVEGNGGPLRVGLPWQSVHDGAKFIHEPLRLSVCIEAPREAMSAILERHPGVRALFDQNWLHLFALDDEGQMAWRYAGGLEWVAYCGDLPGESASEKGRKAA
jgi:hypothetical protein